MEYLTTFPVEPRKADREPADFNAEDDDERAECTPLGEEDCDTATASACIARGKRVMPWSSCVWFFLTKDRSLLLTAHTNATSNTLRGSKQVQTSQWVIIVAGIIRTGCTTINFTDTFNRCTIATRYTHTVGGKEMSDGTSTMLFDALT